ncbi:MAG: hypothetical protein FWC50_13100 [Planctomycetaceae bacterium]|nr:hypothetical protein [Planctomycetaceae bacterium]
MNKTVLISFVLLMCLIFGVTTGCWAKKLSTYTVTGKVTVDGEPIEKGAIMFAPVDGQTAMGGGAIINGNYTAEVPPGKKKVLVSGGKVTGKEPLYKIADSPMRDKLVSVTPMQYNHQTTTNLEAEISGKTENLDFDLSSKFKGTR